MNTKHFSIIAFFIVLSGITAQAWHIYNLASFMSNYKGISNVYESLFLSFFFSVGLLYFSLKLGSLKTNNKINQLNEAERAQSKTSYLSKRDKYMNIINILTVFECFVNEYYWLYRTVYDPAIRVSNDGSLSIKWSAINWPEIPPALVFGIMIPLLIRAYSGEIRLKLND